KRNKKIAFEWNSMVDEVLDSNKDIVTGVCLKDVKSGALRELACDGIFIAIGHTPNTGIFRGQLEMDDQGYIRTLKASMSTTVEGVFAAGDCQDHVYRQAITAAGSGCMAAIDVERYLSSQRFCVPEA
ncbi:MAG: FAD-dependent oxidoreductase, partial [bacterium]